MALTSGDIAIIGVNTDTPDSFSFVALTDIPQSETIFFTDNGVLSDGSIRPNEGTLTYTPPAAGLTAGDVVTVNAADLTASSGTLSENGSFALSTSGDQLFAYQGSEASPTFIFAVQTNSTVFQTNSNDSNQSDLPPGLTVGTTAVAVGAGSGAESEFDNSTYNESVTSGTKTELLAAIADAANWDGSNSLISPLADGPFTVTSATPSAGTFTISDVTANEGDGSADFVVTLTEVDPNSPAAAIEVSFETRDGTADGGTDFIPTTGNLIFVGNEGEQQTITVPIFDDSDVEGEETFTVALTQVSESSGQTFLLSDGGEATGTIIDNDVANGEISINDVTVNEDAGVATFTVTLTALTGAFTDLFGVEFSTSNGTAVAGEDYTETSGTLPITSLLFNGDDGETQTISVPITDDMLVEGDETFTVTLGQIFVSGSDTIVISDGTGIGTITDNDVAPPVVGQLVESFEEAPGTTYTLSAEFNDGFDYFGRFAVPDNSNDARDDFQDGFDGGFAIQGQDHDGVGANATQTVTIPNVDISSLGAPIVTLSLGALDGEPAFSNYEGEDGIDIFATVDSGARTLIGSFAPDADGGDLLQDTDLDGAGDGTALTTALSDFSFALPNTGTSLTLEIELTSNSSFEPLVLDNVRIADPVFTINEVDADTPGSDMAEFIEIFDGGIGNLALDGLSVVLYNGSDDRSYNAFDLDGFTTNADGFFVIGNPGVENVGLEVSPGGSGFLQNGADAVALYRADATSFPNDTPITTTGLLDAVVYDTSDADDSGLLNGLGETVQVNENANNDDDNESNSRVPDGTGDFVAQAPTPGAANTVDPGNGGNVFIHQVQGTGGDSPLLGQTVTVTGVVVGDFQDGVDGTDGDFNGFYLQEEDSDADADATTSEGIFIFDGSNPLVNVAKGEIVEVTGEVTEFFGETQLSNVSVTVIDGGDNSALASASTITFPVASSTTNSDGELIADLEAFEGMLVNITDTLTVSDLFTLGRFGDIGLHADGRLPTFTQVNAPSVSGFQAYQDLAVRNTVTLDDGSTIQNPDTIPFDVASAPGDVAGELDANDELRSGDTVSDLTGVVRFGRGSGGSGDEIYRINPVEEVVFQNDNPRDATAPDVGGDVTVASFNVLNFFTSINDDQGRNGTPLNAGPTPLEPRGANDLTTASTSVAPSTQAQNDALAEFDRQLDKLVAAVAEIGADIFGLVELENEFPGFADATNLGGQTAVERLITELNTAIPAANYQFAAPSNGDTFGDSGDAITVGLIYDANTMQIATGTTVEVLRDADLAPLGVDPGVAVFDGASTNRAPIAATFEEIASGETFTVAVNHFKSKGSPGPSPTGDADIGDGVGNANQTRLNASIALDAWLDTDPTGSGDEDFLIIGDLNAYAQEDPIQFLFGEGFTDLAQEFSEDDFTYSFAFPLDLGTSPQVQAFGTLDYGLASGSLLAQVTDAAEWHINADESVIFDYNLEFRPQAQADGLFGATPFRSSDHDPLIIGLDLGPLVITGTPQEDVLVGTSADEIFEGLAGDDTLIGGGGNDTFNGGPGFDVVSYDDVTTGALLIANLRDETQNVGEALGDVYNSVGGLIGGETVRNRLEGNEFGNLLIGGGLSDVLTGNGGNDRLFGFAGSDNINGGAGNDRIGGGEGVDILFGGEGDGDIAIYRGSLAGVDVDLTLQKIFGFQSGGDAQGDFLQGFERVWGSNFNDTLTGDDNDNVLFGFLGDDTIDGQGGDDRIAGNAGADSLDGGAGDRDVLVYRGSAAGVEVDLATGTASGGAAQGDTIANFERVQGSDFNDILTGDAGDNVLQGFGGDDTIDGGDGVDFITGGAGADSLDGGAGLFDTVSYASSAAGVTIDLAAGTASGGDAAGDTLQGFERVRATNSDDMLTGDALNNLLIGLGGNDMFVASAGDDRILGGAGSADQVIFSGNQADFTVAAITNGVTVTDNATGDVDTLFGIETLVFDDTNLLL
ncbi:MAG: ExeM/NucH family extracellular endonuclease [Pseudomonadota bacterium]